MTSDIPFDILVAGEINPDLILMGDVKPEFGQVEKLIDSATLTIGSSSVIFACGAARLGFCVAFIGACGDDVFGRFMLDEMQKRNTYTYGLGRISQTNTSTEYFLGDALGSVRQVTASNGDVTLAKSYDPYGVVTQAGGTSQSAYGYTGKAQDSYTSLVYLRARFYNP
ncbi:MAG: PfkB family carbohydrate kinase [Anaerolineales bacterium]|nr:PfkB family carbohydrate kinase [Anaerolineales bacterium]